MSNGNDSDANHAATMQRPPEDTPTLAGEQLLQAAVEFVPGTVLANRYRIVSKLGKGGMGEVYRADDLKLGLPVALKFLTPGKALTERQQQLLEEVRIGRDVSHPNVCRLYDIGDVNGQLFISMEYIDGEDLASLLRRIGHLPGDKALALARDICAGLAAAHDRGIVHRDLKPANIMIDGRGRARITDFGLARTEGHRDEEGLVSGTPAYMSPEQFEGQPATVASDLYAVGLILYEIWSGRRVVSGASLAEIIEQHRSASLRESLKNTPEIDRAVGAVIEKCLARDPAARPASARAVLAMLPGGDVLDAAVAAGETPSPGMIAAASAKGDLSRAAAWSCLFFIVAGVVALAAISQRTTVRGRVSLPYPPSQLEVRAQQVISAIGWSEREVARIDQASWLQIDRNFLRWLEPRRTPTSIDPAIRFIYRQSPRAMIPSLESQHRISSSDPPLDEPGMMRLEFTGAGHLRSFVIVPPPTTPATRSSETQWAQLIELAGLKPESLQRSTPAGIAPVDNDQKAAWTGRDPIDNTSIRIEAASLRGLPVWFSVTHPWNGARQRHAATAGDAIGSTMGMVLYIGLPIGALLLARRNLRRGQGDRKGATRLAYFVLITGMTSSLLKAHHVGNVQEEGVIVGLMLAYVLLIAVSTWFVYIALEPFARRWWPKTLISWSRLLEGRVLDPMIGRDLLVGLTAGLVVSTLSLLTVLVPSGWFGATTALPLRTSLVALGSLRDAAYSLLTVPAQAVVRAAGLLAVFVLLRGLLRNQTAAIVAGTVLLGASSFDMATGPVGLRAALVIVTAPVALFLLFRVGLVALLAELMVFGATLRIPLTLDPSSWYFGRSLLAMSLLVALALFAFWRSLGGKPMLPGPVFEE